MKIESAHQAEEAIADVCEWIKRVKEDDICSMDGEGKDADYSREFCFKLLECSSADGRGGCQLCQS